MTTVQPHAKVWHRHGGVKIIAQSVMIRKRVQGRIRQFKLGLFCPYCGFQPNDDARAMHQQTLEKILATRSRMRQARRKW